MREVKFEVYGPFACFTMPETKGERMSYPVITPSAARNLTQAIFWKPEIEWEISRIRVLKAIQFLTVKRNEIKSKARKNPINVVKDRTQRTSVILKDVGYEITVHPLIKTKGQESEKYLSILERRIAKGQHYMTPYLGCREFTAFIRPAEDTPAVPMSADFGTMLFDQHYPKEGKTESFFFPVVMKGGVIDVPSREKVMGVHA